mmetsp:Transcript_51013/g.121189  ORF Transcript_51013/g.121189 Transcript_51013/m.121189 type:complete len:81 (-) Transcript_51013:55-297(-)
MHPAGVVAGRMVIHTPSATMRSTGSTRCDASLQLSPSFCITHLAGCTTAGWQLICPQHTEQQDASPHCQASSLVKAAGGA